MVKFFISRLEKEPVQLDGNEPAELLEIDPEEAGFAVTSPVHYQLTGSLVSGGVLVSGEVETTISGICGRCLEETEQKISTGKLDLFFDIPQGTEECDVTEDIRAEMLLALPMNLLCSEDCRGLCPQCGTNRNRESCNCDGEPGGSLAWSALDGLKL